MCSEDFQGKLKVLTGTKNYQERKNYQDQLDLLLNGVKD